MTPTFGDPSLYFLHNEEQLYVIIIFYVDDSLLTGDTAFPHISDKSLQRFQSRDRLSYIIQFAEIKIFQNTYGTELDQKAFNGCSELLPDNSTFPSFLSFRSKFSLEENSRPDITRPYPWPQIIPIKLSARTQLETSTKS